MAAPIINKNKTSKMEVGSITEIFQLQNQDIRYRLKINDVTYSAIPLVNILPLSVGDKVIVLFEDSKTMSTPFIIGKYNQKKTQDSLVIKKRERIEKQKDVNGLSYETPYSYIKLDSTRKKITIGNKDNDTGKIVIDEGDVYIGGINLNSFMKNINEKIQNTGGNNNLSLESEKDIFLNSSGKIVGFAEEINFLSSNFTIRNGNEMQISTPHVNFTSSFVEFNVITPKGYDLKQKNAYSFFAVDGNFSIFLGKGDFNLKSMSPLSKYNFLIFPATPFSGVAGSMAGFSLKNTESKISHLYDSTGITLKTSSFQAKVLKTSTMELKMSSFVVKLLGGLAKMELTPTKFSITLGSNSMTLNSSGLEVKSGDIEAFGGDVLATTGLYSLSKHKHPTAVPGGPSPPTPG